MTVCTTVYSATARTSEFSSFSFFNTKDDTFRRSSKTKHHHHIQQKHFHQRMSAKKKKKLSTTAMTLRRTEEEKERRKSRFSFTTTTNNGSFCALEAKSPSTTRHDEDFAEKEAKSSLASETTRRLRKSRRSIVLLQVTSSMAALMSEAISEEKKAFALASSSPEDVPKDYAEKLRSACELLLKSIEFERAHPSASVSERFAAADPAKQAVKEYIQTWQGRPETRDLETSAITGEVLRELARYYKKNGSQVALDAQLRDDVVVPKLNEVLNMLPAKAPTLAERVLGISNSSKAAN